jgi:hypothetical protein
LQGRADPSDVLQEAFLDFQSRAAEYAQQPDMPFFLWLRFLTGQLTRTPPSPSSSANSRIPSTTSGTCS